MGCVLAWMAAGMVVGCGSSPSSLSETVPLVKPAAKPATPAAPAAVKPIGTKLPPAAASRTWVDFKRQAAQRMVAANPDGSYMGAPQPMLLAIPVLEIELNADGSVKHIDVMRRPSQAPETIQLAIDAVRRAAPYGDVSRLPKPWKFAEVFLFNDDKRFKPRTLD